MSEEYEADLAAEEAIFRQIAAAEPHSEMHAMPSKGGRPSKVDPIKLVAWRQGTKASIAATAKRWHVSEATVKLLCRDYGEVAKLERARWQHEQLDKELCRNEYELKWMFLSQRNRHLSWVALSWYSACNAVKGTDQEEGMEAARAAAMSEAGEAFRIDWERSVGPSYSPSPR